MKNIKAIAIAGLLFVANCAAENGFIFINGTSNHLTLELYSRKKLTDPYEKGVIEVKSMPVVYGYGPFSDLDYVIIHVHEIPGTPGLPVQSARVDFAEPKHNDHDGVLMIVVDEDNPNLVSMRSMPGKYLLQVDSVTPVAQVTTAAKP